MIAMNISPTLLRGFCFVDAAEQDAAAVFIAEDAFDLQDDIADNRRFLTELEQAVMTVLQADDTVLTWIPLCVLLRDFLVEPIVQVPNQFGDGRTFSTLVGAHLLDSSDEALTNVTPLNVGLLSHA